MKRPDAILLADPHFRDSQPRCRTDNFINAQMAKACWLHKLQEKYQCPVLCSGDIFEKALSSSYIMTLMYRYLPKIYSVPGNHDLPNHSMEQIMKSSLNLLGEVGKIKILDGSKPFVFKDFVVQGFPFKTKLKKTERSGRKWMVALVHYYAYKGRRPDWSDSIGCSKIMKKLKGFDLIVTGDNHKPFTYKKDGQLLVNPGSLTRHKADQFDHRPRVYLWFAEDNRVEKVYVPIEPADEVMSRDHIETVNIRNEKIELFVSRLENDFSTGLSFRKNIHKAIKANDVGNLVRKKILESLP